MLIQQHKAHSRFLPFFLCSSCLSSLYQAISLFPPPQSSQVQHLLLAAPLAPLRLWCPSSPSQVAALLAIRPLTPSSWPVYPLPTLLDPPEGVGLSDSERGRLWFVFLFGFHCITFLEDVYTFQTKAVCCKLSVSRCPSLTRGGCGPHHTAQLPCFRHLLILVHRIKQECMIPL